MTECKILGLYLYGRVKTSHIKVRLVYVGSKVFLCISVPPSDYGRIDVVGKTKRRKMIGASHQKCYKHYSQNDMLIIVIHTNNSKTQPVGLWSPR